MGEHLTNIFTKNYPIESLRTRLLSSLSIGLFVYLFLAILEPFHLNLLEQNKSMIVLGYGIASLTILILLYVLPPLILSSVFNESKWKVYNEIIWLSINLIAIGFAVAIYEDIIGTRPIQFFRILESIGKTFIIGIIPLTVMIFYNRYRLLQKHLKEASVLASDMGMISDKASSITVHFSAEGKNESYSCLLTDLLGVSVTGNYVVIHDLKNLGGNKIILRSTLANVEKELADYSEIFRCHRAHLVNLNNVKDVKGNANGYDLYFDIKGLVIPVSKRKTSDFKKLMKGK